MRKLALALPLIAALNLTAIARADELPVQARELFTKAQSQPHFAEAAILKPVVLPTSDGYSFAVIWIPKGTPPSHWVISLHDRSSFATNDLALWSPYIARRDVGIICLQWWLGKGETASDYYSPREIYREIDTLMEQLHARPQSVMLVGSGQGASNMYAIAALDRLKRQYFSLFVANAGGANMDFQPNQTIDAGVYGVVPYASSKWVIACGQKDMNDQTNCAAMNAAATWVEKMGGRVMLHIEDNNGDSSAFQHNGTNINKVLNLFLNTPS